MIKSDAEIRQFIHENALPSPAPSVPDISIYTAHESLPLWQRAQDFINDQMPPPYWAFAWLGGQALARHILENPEFVRGLSVLDFGSGSGLVGIAAALSGASSVLCADIDPFAIEAIQMNSALNGVSPAWILGDLVGQELEDIDVVLAGDMFYEQKPSASFEIWFRELASRGKVVLIGDPGRHYVPGSGCELLGTYRIRTIRELEDNDEKDTRVFRILP